jgi:hypothetical protein
MKQSFRPRKGSTRFQPERRKLKPTLTTAARRIGPNIAEGDRCTFVFVDNNGKEFPCQHQKSLGGKFCVFHRDDVKAKASEFAKAIEQFIVSDGWFFLPFPVPIPASPCLSSTADLAFGQPFIHGGARKSRQLAGQFQVR